MAITPDRDVGVGPAAADVAEQPPDMSCRLSTRWRLAGTQQHGDRSPGRGVIDMDRHETALTMMAVPERELLISVHDIAGIIYIQRHRRRRGRIAGAIYADHLSHHARQFACGRRILPPAHGRLAGETGTRTGQFAQGQTSHRPAKLKPGSSRNVSRSSASS